MTSRYVCFGLLVLMAHLSDGAQDKLTKDGNHNPHFDHEAILGSTEAEEEFDKLPPEEAKKRLRIIAKKMDGDGSGQVTRTELIDWILNSFNRLHAEVALREFKLLGRNNRDGQVAWKDYKDNYYDNDFTTSTREEVEQVKKEESGDYAKFQAADKNNDRRLNEDEYVAFQLSLMQEHDEVDEEILEHDKNKDSLLTFEEYYGEDDSGDKQYENYKRNLFNRRDLNKDGFWDKKEMKSMSMQDDNDTAREETIYLINVSDDNKDGQLSIEEIVAHHEHFVGSKATHHGGQLHYFKDEL